MKMLRILFLGMIFTALMNISAFGTDVFSGNSSKIDVSSASNGYVSVSSKSSGNKKLKVIIAKDKTQYIYSLKNNGDSEVFPLQMGNGTYQIKVMENVTGTKYAAILTGQVNAKLVSEFAPFLIANQYVNYRYTNNAIKTAEKITKSSKSDLETVKILYEYVINAMAYDTQKAKTVQSGYLPDIDKVLVAKKGICFDYAAVYAAMLRSQGIPTKLITGYVAPNNAYHAWNEVFIKDVGWMKTGEFYFDGKTWKLMDPTFGSSGKNSSKTVQFIGNGTNYTKKYVY